MNADDRLVGITKGNDPRNRYLFIANPIKQVHGIEPNVIDIFSWKKTFRSMKSIWSNRKKYGCMILASVGSRELLLIAFCRVIGVNQVTRLGGNPFRSFVSHTKGLSLRKNPKSYLFRMGKRLISRLSIAISRNIVVVSPKQVDEIAPYTSSKSRFWVIPPYIEPTAVEERVDERPDHGKNIRTITIVNLDFIEKFEGVQDLIRYQDLFCSKTGVKIEYNIFGRGKFSQKIEDIQNNYEPISENFSFHYRGFTPDPVHEASLHDVFLYKSTFESFGNIIVEAREAGTVTLCYRMDSSKYLIEDTENGYLFDGEEEFAEKLGLIMASDTADVVENALKDNRRRFSMEPVGHLWMDCINSVRARE